MIIKLFNNYNDVIALIILTYRKIKNSSNIIEGELLRVRVKIRY